MEDDEILSQRFLTEFVDWCPDCYSKNTHELFFVKYKKLGRTRVTVCKNNHWWYDAISPKKINPTRKSTWLNKRSR